MRFRIPPVFLFLVTLPSVVGPAVGRGAEPVQRLESVVVTATRTETPQDEVASSTTVITGKELRSKQRADLADVLRDVPGLSVTNSGGAGRQTYVSMRGSDSGHTLVLVDGIEMNDALSTTCSFDFGNLGTQDVERIEVIRGSQSVLYGSNATGGVINIITKKGRQSATPSSSVEAEYGTYNTYRVQGSVRGGDPGLAYYLGAGRRASDGFPAADKNLGNTLNAGQALNTVTGSVATDAIPRTKIEASARFSDARFDLAATGGAPGYDAFGGRTGEDPGQKGTDRQLYAKVSARTHATDAWTTELSVTQGVNHRTSDHEPNSLSPVESHSTFDSHRTHAAVQNDVSLSDLDTLTVGVESALEKGSSIETYSAGGTDVGLKDKQDIFAGVFLQDQWLSDSFFATAGARYDAHEHLQSKATYRVAPGVRVAATGTTFRGSVGSGFKVPSLYQRFSSYGDPGLKPESSVSWDAGVEQAVGSGTKLGVTYFHTSFEDLISYDLVKNHYANIGKAHTEGVEATARWAPHRKWELSGTYTYLIARDDSDGVLGLPLDARALLRRPAHQFSLGADHHFSDRAQVGALARFVGARPDIDAVTGSRLTMPAYAVFYVTGRYQVSKDFRVFGRVDNLLDRAYEEVNGFGTPGRSLFIGVGEEI